MFWGKMKIAAAVLVGMAVLGISGGVGVSRMAQQPRAHANPVQPQGPPKTRIAVMNMVQVLKSYKKFLKMEGEMKNLQAQLQARIEPLKEQMLKALAEYKRPGTSEEEREKLEKQMRKIRTDTEIVQEDAKKELMKRSGEAFTTIYRDVEDAVKRYAEKNGYELVMFYNDRVNQDKYNPSNVRDKLVQPAALMPIYITPGMDITPHIIESLNRTYSDSGSKEK